MPAKLSWVSSLLLITLLLLGPNGAAAQDDDDSGGTPLAISLGTVRTELEQIAVSYAVKYAKAFSGADVLLATDNGAFYFTPEIDMEVGEEDAFNNVIAKLTGSMLLFRTTDIDGVITPNTAFFHTFPFSAGIESSNRFDTVNILAEAGYVPWFQGSVRPFWKTLRLGVFVQGGYKAEVEDPPMDVEATRGGSADESSEEPGSGLFRLKGSGIFSPAVKLDKVAGMGLGAKATGDVWYDVLHSEVYYALEATFSILISSDKSFDFSYQKGSGAPNFNEGSQFSTKLTIEF